MKLFKFSEKSLLTNVIKMMASSELLRVYSAWRTKAEENGNVHVETSCEVYSIQRGTNK